MVGEEEERRGQGQRTDRVSCRSWEGPDHIYAVMSRYMYMYMCVGKITKQLFTHIDMLDKQVPHTHIHVQGDSQ